MQSLLKLSRGIDAFTKWVGKRLAWLILVAVVVATVNAIIRKSFDMSSKTEVSIMPKFRRSLGTAMMKYRPGRSPVIR